MYSNNPAELVFYMARFPLLFFHQPAIGALSLFFMYQKSIRLIDRVLGSNPEPSLKPAVMTTHVVPVLMYSGAGPESV